MKLALCLMVNDNDLPFLKLHLPVYRNSFDGLVALADPEDGREAAYYMETCGAILGFARWEYNWGDWATKLFRLAEDCGYDAALRMDADETVWPDAGYHIREKLRDEASLLVLPRHEFFGDRYHVRQELWPDGQARAWRLRRGIIVQGKKHEGIDFQAHELSEDAPDPEHKVLRLLEERYSIYHYGWGSKTAIWRAMTRYQSQAQVALGQSPIVAFPEGQPIAYHPTIPFDRPQPLDPEEVGAYAPYVS